MPIYEYLCPSCKEKFEQRRPMSQSDEDAPCPTCRMAAPRTLSRVARVSRGGDGGDDFGDAETPMPGGGDFGMGGHGHSHGPMGHGH